MSIFNKHFWKFVAGFLSIIVVGMVALWGFRSWQDYKEKEELRTLLRAVESRNLINN